MEEPQLGKLSSVASFFWGGGGVGGFVWLIPGEFCIFQLLFFFWVVELFGCGRIIAKAESLGI